MRLRRRTVWALAVAAMLAAAVALGARWAAASARSATDRSAIAIARTHAGLLASELQKFRLLPLVLAEYPDVARALAGADGPAVGRLDATLELLAARTDAAALYAIDLHGRAVAASNWRLPTSFVGQDYAFRGYFTDAMRRGQAEVFALGTVSRRPGLYLARRIDRGGRPLGVIVVKVEFDRLEREWAQASGATVVIDPHGLILVTSMSGWRFHPTRPLDAAAAAALRRSRQFGAALPATLAFRLTGRDAIRTPRLCYRVAEAAVPLRGGRLLHLTPLAPQLAAARGQAMLWGAGLLLVLGLVGGTGLRAAERRRLQSRARAALEEEVARRTAELRDSNARLVVESEERAEADRRFRAAREELAQANRLGSLGQITAGVAHEINQPLAAIRTFAENGTKLIDRDAPERARENLGRIVELTERIGAITGELRAFARRRTPSRGAPTIGEAIDGTLMLIGDRARGIVVDAVPADLRAVRVHADRIRLEQILVNLVQNALDAVVDTAGARVTIAARSREATLDVQVNDNGPGVDASLDDTLFTPFASAKAGGLGLGLAIARDIAIEFGGGLALARGTGPGAVFVLTLRRA
ncbi:sensor histidine kinase [Sphingomonas sp. A2-49]|uniref:sensor histidine kinase n=1 Tax=Sphingomonas sp. A2-49 TaxID=1391375 RepID=UPI0021D05984|nr:ATP-binding protein [Sphingomonas sp. A2-49]MCU6454747.1 sensor histidine kinase [Sphingomonas sp. A2-49]